MYSEKKHMIVSIAKETITDFDIDGFWIGTITKLLRFNSIDTCFRHIPQRFCWTMNYHELGMIMDDSTNTDQHHLWIQINVDRL